MNVYLGDGFGQGFMAYDCQTLEIIHLSTNLFASGGCFVRFDPNGNIYLGDALDWVNNGVVYIYSADEVLLNTITVGVIPQDAGFYNFDVGVDDDFGEEDLFSLSNYPNPFSTSTTIFFLATDLHGLAQIKIYNIKGQLVKQLKRQSPIYSGTKGKSIIEWDGTDIKGQNVKSGIYLYQVEINGKKSKIRKAVLIK